MAKCKFLFSILLFLFLIFFLALKDSSFYRPRDLANQVFELYLQQRYPTRANTNQEFHVLNEIRKHITTHIDITTFPSSQHFDKLVKSVRQQFYRLQ
jgi:hypothetical protein